MLEDYYAFKGWTGIKSIHQLTRKQVDPTSTDAAGKAQPDTTLRPRALVRAYTIMVNPGQIACSSRRDAKNAYL